MYTRDDSINIAFWPLTSNICMRWPSFRWSIFYPPFTMLTTSEVEDLRSFSLSPHLLITAKLDAAVVPD